MKPPVLVLHAPGTNRDRDVAEAFALAGADPHIVTLGALIEAPERIADFRLVCVPGGFSFGDDLGAGKVLALHLRLSLGDALREHLGKGRPILGICNGFQALIKAGFFAANAAYDLQLPHTLTRNARAQFECRWVTLHPNAASTSPWLSSLTSAIDCPVAHGEGRLVATDTVAENLLTGPQAAFRYDPTPDTTDGYPGNPNGSLDHLAGITDPSGLVLGLMPHPEDHIFPFQHPAFHTGRQQHPGLPLFQAGVRLAAQA